MPIKTSYDPEKRILFGEITGPFDPQELITCFHSIFANPAIPDDVDAIWDLRGMDFSTASPDALHTYISTRTEFNAKRRGAKYALIVSGDEEERVVKLFWALTEHIEQESRIFESIDAAADWIYANGVPNS